jgi:hypothetical protein
VTLDRNPPPSSPQQALARAVARLPQAARSKYNKLVSEAEDARALVRATVERRKVLEDRYTAAANRRPDPRYELPDREAHQDELAQARAALDAVEEQLSARNAAQGRADQIVSQLKQFLVLELRGRIRAASVTAPRNGEDIKAAIMRVRAELGTAHADLASAKTTTPTRAELEQQLKKHVQSLVTAGRPSLNIDNGRLVVTYPDQVMFSGSGVYSAPSGSASKLFAAIDPDRMYDYLSQWLEDIPAGLTAAERELRVAQLEQHIRRLEQQEECLIEMAQAQGVDVPRIFRSGWSLLLIEADTQQQLQAAE